MPRGRGGGADWGGCVLADTLGLSVHPGSASFLLLGL